MNYECTIKCVGGPLDGGVFRTDSAQGNEALTARRLVPLRAPGENESLPSEHVEFIGNASQLGSATTHMQSHAYDKERDEFHDGRRWVTWLYVAAAP